MILKDCMNYLEDSFSAALLTGGASAFLYFMILVCRAFFVGGILRRKIIWKSWKIPFVALLGFYCYFVFSITIFSREKGSNYIIHLAPFGTWGTDFWHLTLWLENLLLLMPLGILLYILWAPFRKIGWSALTGFLCSLTIECVQLLGRLGKFELDDIMNNVLGMLFGFWLCKGVYRIFFHNLK